mgnify:CR=1 FL=1
MSEFESIELYFKQVYTCKTKVYHINLDYTLAKLYEFITAKAFSDDFGINSNSYKIEIVENNSIQIRTATIIEKDAVEISRTYHRHVVCPGDDIVNEDAKVQAIANAIWTEEVIAAYQALIANNTL